MKKRIIVLNANNRNNINGCASLYIKIIKCFSILFLLISPCIIKNSYALSGSDLLRELEDAEEIIKQTYLIILDIEDIGGNVSELVTTINKLLEFIQQSKAAYSKGRISEAIYYTKFTNNLTTQIMDRSIHLKENVLLSNSTSSRQKLLITIFLSIIVVISGYFLWKIIERNSLKTILRYRPEVARNET